MKMKFILVPATLFVAFLFFNFTTVNNTNPAPQAEKHDLGITPDVQKIIDNSCFGCHNAEARGDKAKAKLMFETLDTMSVAKLVGKLGDISDEVSEDNMPPAKFLEFKLEAKLTPEQKDALIKWAETKAEALLKK